MQLALAKRLCTSALHIKLKLFQFLFIYLFIVLSSSYVYVSVYVFCTEQQHIDFAVAAGMQYLIGDRCLVVLSIYRQDSNFCSTSKFYN